MWQALGLFWLCVGFGPPLSKAQFGVESNNRAWPGAADEALASVDADQLAAIVDELRALRYAEQIERSPYAFEAEAPIYPRASNEELAQFGHDMDAFKAEEAAAAAAHEANVDEYVNAEVAPAPNAATPAEETRAKPAAQKKAPIRVGQFEFVEFVEPHHAKALKNVEYLDKRAPLASISDDQAVSGAFPRRLIFGSNNVFFLVAITVGSVATVVGVVGGGYYLNTVRKQRAEAFDDFTRYSPSGPGRDMLRKGRGFAGSPISDVHGDDALAKAAHLHHYTQTKQKIIGEDNGVHDDEHTDDEADDLEEPNFSIYECPGLAPTSGDIEVTNPNFAAQHP